MAQHPAPADPATPLGQVAPLVCGADFSAFEQVAALEHQGRDAYCSGDTKLAMTRYKQALDIANSRQTGDHSSEEGDHQQLLALKAQVMSQMAQCHLDVNQAYSAHKVGDLGAWDVNQGYTRRTR